MPDIIEVNECLWSYYTAIDNADVRSRETHAKATGRYWSDTETEPEEVATDEASSESDDDPKSN